MPGISIIIPVYNVETYLKSCIDSVRGQTFADFELLLIDDGSTDCSGKIADAAAEQDVRIAVLHQENGGVSEARNIGLAKAQGKYLFFMDSDDLLVQDALEKLYACAEATKADIVIADHSTFRQGGKPVQQHFFSKPFLTDNRETISALQRMVLHPGFSPDPTRENRGIGLGAPWTKLIRRTLVETHALRFDPFVCGIFDDGLFSLAIFQHAGRVAYLRENTYLYRKLPSSLIHRFYPAVLETHDRVFQRIAAFSETYELGETFLQAYYARIIQYLIRSFLVYFFHPTFPKKNRERNRSVRETLRSEPYHTAIANVWWKPLNRMEKTVVLLARCRAAWLICWIFQLRKIVKGDSA